MEAACAILTESRGTPVHTDPRAGAQPGSRRVGGRTEALLLAADLAQHVASVIRPALGAGRDVVTDRYAGSTLASHCLVLGLE